MRLHCGAKVLDLSRPQVMGVLNVTPDSFSDGGRFSQLEAAVSHALKMVGEGAALIDIGGESTRPGAAGVAVEEELRRVIPVIEALAKRLESRADVVISIDTSKPEVMRAATAAGAGLINDVRALREPGALAVAAVSGCAVCLMHMQGEPRTMQLNPVYADVVSDIKAFLSARVHSCRAAGIRAERIVLDPGFGFGKTVQHNLELLRRLEELTALDLPLLVGLSRKSMLATLLGRPVQERMPGSVALATLAAFQGARIIRAHDVAATVDAVRIAHAVRQDENDGG